MRKARRSLLGLGGATVLLNALPAGARAGEVRVIAGPAFGSAWRLVLPRTRDEGEARERVERVVARVDARMSPFRDRSEVARFNRAGRAALSDETARVARAALALARDSGGAFDPTTAPLSRRYGFGAAAIAATRPAARYRDLELAGGVMTTRCRGLSLDLCGIAKGHALDEIARELDGLDFLVELGGEVAARGRHPGGRAWRIGVERPGEARVQRVVAADRRAMATSGDAAQFYQMGARRHAHVIDPREGAPVAGDVASVSVLAHTGIEADGLATAAMVLGPAAARPLLAARGASALFLLRRAGGFEEVDVNGFLSGEAA